MSGVVGRGGLEPPTSAVLGPERSTTESGAANETGGVIRREEDEYLVLRQEAAGAVTGLR